MAQSVKLIFLVLAVVLFGGQLAKGQQEEDPDLGQEGTEATEFDEQNNQPSESNRVGRIVNGAVATSANLRYTALIYAYSSGRMFNLVGAVISNTQVLTSASALRTVGNITGITVIVGSNPSSTTGISYTDTSYQFHSGFNPSNKDNDVAVITVNGTFAGQPNVQPITIATTEIPVSPTDRPTCVVVGWKEGSLNVGEANYTLATTPECNSIGNNPPSIMCARAGSGYACNLDSGAPLVCNGQLYGVLTDQSVCSSSNLQRIQKFAKLPVITIPGITPAPRKNYVSCP
ncbi:trypsin delta-like [Anopheles albimanus]|uniref:trypsin delta-like n=1 Tax=Anopheles albimanus TaxID=7167 RepID=UPI00163F7259|nr:trypsin delta-like [Anopheles albimanus]